jgi:glutamate-1-semialdehyde 2,1-aminomutase
MVNSGTEACMSALRVARGYTGKNKFIKFEGCYHGHADMFLVKAGSGVATFGIQEVPGVTAGTANDTLTAPYNDLAAVRNLVETNKDQIAAIIVEPVAGNMGCVLPEPGFLEGLRQICDEEHMLLIFDEVMTGFRLAPGGAQQRLGVDADLVTYGKVIGAGLPVGAFGGKKAIMERVAPLGDIYQAGTLSGNPLAMIAGFTLLTELKDHPEFYTQLDNKGAYLKENIYTIFKEAGIPVQVNQFGSMLSVFFNETPVTDFTTASNSDMALFTKFFHGLLKRGVHLPPSGYESWFLSNALNQSDLDQTLDIIRTTLEKL